MRNHILQGLICSFICRFFTNPEKILEICYEDLLVDITHPCSLATDLLRRKVISCDTANAMLSDDLIKEEKVKLLVNAIMKSTTQNPSAFNALVRSLEDLPSHRIVAAHLKQVQGTNDFNCKQLLFA